MVSEKAVHAGPSGILISTKHAFNFPSLVATVFLHSQTKSLQAIKKSHVFYVRKKISLFIWVLLSKVFLLILLETDSSMDLGFSITLISVIFVNQKHFEVSSFILFIYFILMT